MLLQSQRCSVGLFRKYYLFEPNTYNVIFYTGKTTYYNNDFNGFKVYFKVDHPLI